MSFMICNPIRSLFRVCLCVLAIGGPLVAQDLPSAEYRRWTLASGRASDVQLMFVGREGNVIKLQREDNQKVVELQISQLSPEDRAYVVKLTARPARKPAAKEQTAPEGDWPQWRGEQRTGLSSETGILKQWPSEGPKLAWQIDGLGRGYSTPTIASGKLFVLGTRGDVDVLFALDCNTGRPVWNLPLGPTSKGGGYPGPRGSATWSEGQVFAVSSDGNLIAANAMNGKLLWQKSFRRDFQGRCGSWDFSESPLVDGDAVICTPGGPTASLVSLNRRTGNVNWVGSTNSLGDDFGRAAYSSPIVAEVDGVKQYIQFFNKGVAGFRAEDGQLLWNYDRPANGTANCSTPIYRDGSVFAASGYGTGGGRARLERRGDRFEAVEEYFVNKLQNHHGGVVLVGDHLYGTGEGSLLCVDWRTGEILWQERGVGKGSVVFVDGHLIVRSEKGPVALVAVDSSGYREVSQFDQPNRSDKNAWAHPVVAGGKLYLRDDDILLCYEIK